MRLRLRVIRVRECRLEMVYTATQSVATLSAAWAAPLDHLILPPLPCCLPCARL